MAGYTKGFPLDFNQAYTKAADFCAFQERCISEVKLKLISWNIDRSFIAKILQQLQQEGFINEKRYAVNYAGGKFRMKGWGKIKIAASLRFRSVSSVFISEALQSIDPDLYLQTLETLITKKLQQLGGDSIENKQKAALFAASRGFEPSLIFSLLKDITLPDL